MPRISTALSQYYGIGDLVCLSWIAEATRGTADPITFYAQRGGRYDILKLMGQEVSDDPAGTGVCVYSAYQKELADGGSKPRLAYVTDVLGIPYRFQRPTVNWSEEDMRWARETKESLGEDVVMLFPQTAWEPRAWPSCYWVDLAWQLQSHKVSTVVFLSNQDKRYTNTPKYFWGFSFGQLAALMSLSQIVVGVDSGPAHVAGTVGVPTIILCGPTRPECVFGHMPDVIPLAAHDDPNCTGCHFKPPFRSACDQGCQMLYSLKPHVVVAEIAERLALQRRELRAVR